MSVYFNQTRDWWMYDFQFQKQRYTANGFKTKKEALAAEAERKKELKEGKVQQVETDMGFLTLCNLRLDFLEDFRGGRHYTDTLYMVQRWVKQWGKKTVFQVSAKDVQEYLKDVKRTISAQNANKQLRYIRSMYNWGRKRPNGWFTYNPCDDLMFYPVEKKKKYVPPLKDVLSVLMAAEGEVQDYLWTIALTLGRMSEVNRLKVDDCDFENNKVTLYTRKSKGGNLVPRDIDMGPRLREVLIRRIKDNPTDYVFYHTYCSSKTKEWVTGPYSDRKRIMKTLCKKSGVRYFRYHPFRHFGASMLLKDGTDPKTIQDILGHANFETTLIYLHSLNGSAKKAMNNLEKTLTMGRKSA